MKSNLKQLYRHSLTLLTDLYQLTMAYGYWHNEIHEREAVFHLFFRKHPFGGDYSISCGLEMVIEYLQDFKFDVEDIQYLGSLKGADGKALFNESFLNYLQRMEFQCDIEALPEGTAAFPHQPLIRVRGPLIQAQLIETALLTIINFQTLIATKAARIAAAAQDDSVLEFGLRRAQGIDGGISASRAAYIGGCHATSNVLAGKLYGIPVKGTHAHSWVMCHENELAAFEDYAEAMPNNCVFLVDTYNTVEGVRNAIKVGKQLQSRGFDLLGVRLDSGDLADLSIKARQLLDEAGFENAAIVASDSLDEYEIKRLKEQGAKISIWGVGTRLATAFDQPALGGVYKLAAMKDANGNWDYKMKLSDTPMKVSNPGLLNVLRFYDKKGKPIGDLTIDETVENSSIVKMYDETERNWNGFDSKYLLKSIFKKGKYVYSSPTIHEIRDLAIEQRKVFSSFKKDDYPAGLEKHLYDKKMRLLDNLRKK
jgi:nicotinate phosphoribosyltransferase